MISGCYVCQPYQKAVRIFTALYRDIANGALPDRSGLEQCLADLNQGDTLIMWKLDRLGRSLPHLVKVVNSLQEKGSIVGRPSISQSDRKVQLAQEMTDKGCLPGAGNQ
jgi:DNA invertase Pin-like site-specific DNA recombinase